MDEAVATTFVALFLGEEFEAKYKKQFGRPPEGGDMFVEGYINGILSEIDCLKRMAENEETPLPDWLKNYLVRRELDYKRRLTNLTVELDEAEEKELQSKIPRLFYFGHELLYTMGREGCWKCVKCAHVWTGEDGTKCPACGEVNEK